MNTSTKPYFIRALYEWAEDNKYTAQVLVNTTAQGVQLPTHCCIEDTVVLNIAARAVVLQKMNNDAIEFSARFNGAEEQVYLPMESILAIFTREKPEGMVFDEQKKDGTNEPMPKNTKKAISSTQKKNQNSHLKVIK